MKSAWPRRLGVVGLIVAVALVSFIACQSIPKDAAVVPPNARSSAPLPLAGKTTVRLATFNIENLGKTKLGKPAIVATLVNVIRAYDLVAVQEISDVTLATPQRFLDAIDRDTGADPFAVLPSPRSGQQPADKKSQEQYAFFFNTRTLRVVDQGALFPDDAENLFHREPFAAEFQTTDGKLTFVVLTIHTDPNFAPKEIAALAKAYDWATTRFKNYDGLILMGDFNGGVAYTKPAEIDHIRREVLPYLWIVPDDADTTLAAKPEAHDRIIVAGRLASLYTQRWGVDRSFSDGAVSDHWPVWAEFSTGSN